MFLASLSLKRCVSAWVLRPLRYGREGILKIFSQRMSQLLNQLIKTPPATLGLSNVSEDLTVDLHIFLFC